MDPLNFVSVKIESEPDILPEADATLVDLITHQNVDPTVQNYNLEKPTEDLNPLNVVNVKIEEVEVNPEIVIKEELSEPGPKPVKPIKYMYQCNICTKPYQHESSLLRHQKLHFTKNKCLLCDKPFRNAKQLEKHQKKHNRPKFNCSQCDREFERLSYLKTHENMHNSIKPFKCDLCDKAFTQGAHLKKHQRKHTGERPYKCRFCEKDFGLSDSLRSHERIHTGEKPYSCKFCSKTMADGSALRRHERTHTGIKPYKCKYCGKEFTRCSGLKHHEKKHSGDVSDFIYEPVIKPFKCFLCTKEFKRKNALKFHVRQKHLQPDNIDSNLEMVQTLTELQEFAPAAIEQRLNELKVPFSTLETAEFNELEAVPLQISLTETPVKTKISTLEPVNKEHSEMEAHSPIKSLELPVIMEQSFNELKVCTPINVSSSGPNI